jgi:hypothetical protein
VPPDPDLERRTAELLDRARSRPGCTLEDVYLSVVLPGTERLDDHFRALAELPARCELLVGGGGAPEMTDEPQPGRPVLRRLGGQAHEWGRAVQTGLRTARGDLLAYAHPGRTSPGTLKLMVAYALANPGTVVRANRRSRDNPVRKLGSLLYNAECRALFDLAVWDINGTPKIFPRAFGELLALGRTDDLIDLEFSVVCSREGYPVVEIPVHESPGEGQHVGIAHALRLYLEVFAFKRRLRSA